MSGGQASLSYFLLSDINLKVKVKINALQGYQLADELTQLALASYSPVTISRDAELYVTCHLYANGEPLGLPCCTAYKCFPTTAIKWNEWLTFPIKYRDLASTSKFVFTVWAVAPQSSPPFTTAASAAATLAAAGSASAPSAAAGAAVASAAGTAASGAAAGAGGAIESMTAAAAAAVTGASTLPASATPLSSLGSAAKLSAKNRLTSTELPVAIPIGGTSFPMFNKRGLVKLGRRKLFLTPGVEGDGAVRSSTPYKNGKPDTQEQLERMLRRWDQRELPATWLDKLALARIEKQQKQEPVIATADENKMYLTIEFPAFKHPIVYHFRTCNPELREILPFKEKDRIFVMHDPERRENPIETKYHKLTRSSKGVGSRDVRPDVVERRQIEAIIASPNRRLSRDHKDLLWKYRYALTDNKRALTKVLRVADWSDAQETKEALDLLGEWAPVDIADALELLSTDFRNTDVRNYAVKQLHRADNDELQNYLLQLVQALRYESTYPSMLSEFLISRATQTMQLANFFHWFLTVERHDKVMGGMYSALHQDFIFQLSKTKDGAAWERALNQEAKLVQRLVQLCEHCKAHGRKVDKKIERLKQVLKPDGEFKDLRQFDSPISIAVRPEVTVTGMIQEQTTMFKSALAPLLAAFNTPDGSRFKASLLAEPIFT